MCDTVGKYGVMGSWKAVIQGKSIVLRADMDALHIEEFYFD